MKFLRASRWRKGAAGAGVLVVLACAALWPLSHIIKERALVSLGPVVPRARLILSSDRGVAHGMLIWRSGGVGGAFPSSWSRHPASPQKSRRGVLGFRLYSKEWNLSGNIPGNLFDTMLGCQVPYWALMGLGTAGIAWALRPPRVAQGVCRHCGYDLRASPQTCPECGRAAEDH